MKVKLIEYLSDVMQKRSEQENCCGLGIEFVCRKKIRNLLVFFYRDWCILKMRTKIFIYHLLVSLSLYGNALTGILLSRKINDKLHRIQANSQLPAAAETFCTLASDFSPKN